jgi:hypothetical protein
MRDNVNNTWMEINGMYKVEPIEWTKREVSGLAESSWLNFICYSWVSIMHFNTYILNDIKAAKPSAVFPFLSDTKWYVKPIIADCSHIDPVRTNCHEIRTYWLQVKWNQYQLTAVAWIKYQLTAVTWSLYQHTSVTWIQYTLTACRMKPVHSDCILHEASTKWLQSHKAIT